MDHCIGVAEMVGS